MKKLIIIAVTSVVGICIVVGAGLLIKKNNDSNSQVTVMPVSSISGEWYGSEMYSSGIITSDVSQDVYLTDGQVVQEVFVAEGDIVDVGDELMSYDMTLVSIDLEKAKMQQQIIDLKLEAATNELEKLKKTKPISSSSASIGISPMTNVSYVTSAVESSSSDVPTDTESSAETEEPIEILPLEELTYDSEPYKGDGTFQSPYVFFCTDSTIITGAFFNKMKGYDALGTVQKETAGFIFVLEAHEGDIITNDVVSAILFKADQLPLRDPEAVWLYSDILYQITNEEGESDLPGEDITVNGGDYATPEGYTKDELEKMILNKQQEINNLVLSKKESVLTIESIEKKLQDQTIKSKIKGVVKTVGDPEKGANADGSPFLSVASEEGLYVSGVLNELALEDIQLGQIMQGYSWESGTSFEAEVREISEYPDTSDSYYSAGNPNASNYSFIAYIDNAADLKNYQYVELTYSVGGSDSSSIYIELSYVREENGESYVYIADENNRIKKQVVKTGKTIYSYYIEILEGITLEDNIAFPYGSNVKVGARAVVDENPMYYYY